MGKLTGVVLVSVMLALAACGGGSQTLITKTYTSNQTVVIPAGVTNLVSVSGQGSPGNPQNEYYVDYYSEHRIVYNTRNDMGGQVFTLDGGTTYHYGTTPSNYCDEPGPYGGQNGVYNWTQTCYEFSDQSYWDTTPATTGQNATGFGQTFPGGVGGPAASQSFSNIAVTPGSSYPLVIPSGASITISYY